MKIGILGGTFNPPHIGHLILGEEIREKFGLDKIFFIPTNLPPHKENEQAAADHRFNMVKLAIENNKFFEVLNLEIKRGGVSYTIDTIKELKKTFPEDIFYLIVGSDLANDFYTWRNSLEIRSMVSIVIAKREKHPFSSQGQEGKSKGGENSFIIVNITQIDISSSQIREMVKQNKSIRYLVREKVADYIEKYELYKK